MAAVLRRGDLVLLCHRRADRRWYPDVWDLPGGHVEPGETPYAALARELFEELGLGLPTESRPADRIVEQGAVRMDVWYVDDFDGEPQNLSPDEHDRIGWFTPDDPTPRPLAHPSYAFLLLGGALRPWDRDGSRSAPSRSARENE